MLKYITPALFILCFSGKINAQESSSVNTSSRFEILAGPSFSMNTGSLQDYNSKAGYAFGIGYYQKISSSFSLNFRSLFERKGSVGNYNYDITDINGIDTNVSEKLSYQFNYLSLYALPTLQFGAKKNFSLSAGGYFSLLQNSSVKINRSITNVNTGDVTSETTTTDPSLNKKYDAGISFMAGYTFKIKDNRQIMLQAYGNRGLVDIYDSWTGGYQRNNTFGLMLSYQIPLKK